MTSLSWQISLKCKIVDVDSKGRTILIFWYFFTLFTCMICGVGKNFPNKVYLTYKQPCIWHWSICGIQFQISTIRKKNYRNISSRTMLMNFSRYWRCLLSSIRMCTSSHDLITKIPINSYRKNSNHNIWIIYL